MDENNKKIRWKLNLFDLLVILVVLAVAAGVVFLRYQQSRASQASQSEGTAPGSATVRYVVELTEMPLQAAEMVQPGDELVVGGYSFKIEKMRRSRISGIRVQKLRAAGEAPAADAGETAGFAGETAGSEA